MRRRHYKLAPDILLNVVKTAGSGVAQLLIGTSTWLILFRILSMFGTSALAGYTIATRIVVFALLPATGLANAAATLVGQNLGARQIARAETAVRIATWLNVALLSVIGVIGVISSYPLARMFTTDPEVLAYGSQALWIMCLAFPLFAASRCLSAAFNGAGDTWTPTRMNFICLWLGEIPLALILAKSFALGPLGVFIAVPLSWLALAVWSYVIFRQGKWKLQKL